ncbi:hypothetical protein HGRIS_014963 [Hohenbuehelia grisea]|uniref:Integrase catalytic domain-containing protein n=1 Tax=Hohenbuehelia grisea TaxID=104357 RepID=A0ABR3JV80_9AGAR
MAVMRFLPPPPRTHPYKHRFSKLSPPLVHRQSSNPTSSSTAVRPSTIPSDREAFEIFISIKPEPVRTADGRAVASAIAVGNMRISFPMGPGQPRRAITLRNVYYVPQMAYTLISVGQIDETNHSIRIEKRELEPCLTCIQAKMPRNSFPKASESRHKYTKYGDKVVVDLWMAPVKSLGGAIYAMQLEDYSTLEEKAYFLLKKSDAFANYLDYEAWMKLHRDGVVKILGADHGGEFTSTEFNAHLKRKGTIRHLTTHDSPQSNGAIERQSRTHANDIRAMLLPSSLPLYLWAEAWLYSTWLRNVTPTHRLPDAKTPHEMATNEKPDVSRVREWGSSVWVKRNLKPDKLESRVVERIYVGVDPDSKAIRVFWPATRTVTAERDYYFHPNDANAPETVSVEGEQPYQHDDDTPKLPKPTESNAKANIAPGDPSKAPLSNEHHDKPENALDNQSAAAPALATTPSAPAKPANTPEDMEELYDSLPRLPDGLQRPEPNTGRGLRERRPTHRYGEGNMVGPELIALLTSIEPANQCKDDDEDWDGEAVIEWDDEGKPWFVASRHIALNTGEIEPQNERVAFFGPEPSANDELTEVERKGVISLVVAPPNVNIVKCRYVFRYKTLLDKSAATNPALSPRATPRSTVLITSTHSRPLSSSLHYEFSLPLLLNAAPLSIKLTPKMPTSALVRFARRFTWTSRHSMKNFGCCQSTSRICRAKASALCAASTNRSTERSKAPTNGIRPSVASLSISVTVSALPTRLSSTNLKGKASTPSLVLPPTTSPSLRTPSRLLISSRSSSVSTLSSSI